MALGRSLAAPANTSPPTISGTAREGSALTAKSGTWSNSPTSFAYQWRRCATDGTACADITGATKETYTLVAGDVSHTIRVEVTAANADGKTAAVSDSTEVVGSENGPRNTARPAIGGTPRVGEGLSVSNGSWSPAPTSYAYRWQRCDGAGEDCRNIAGAAGRTYGVRTVDVDHRLRALVTARTSGGMTTVVSAPSGIVRDNQTTVTTSTTVQGNRAPALTFISLRWFGRKLYVRFRVCDDSAGRIGMTARHNKTRALPYAKRFSVVITSACGTFTKNWIPPVRFRTAGRLVVQLRASDSGRRLSRVATRSIVHR